MNTTPSKPSPVIDRQVQAQDLLRQAQVRVTTARLEVLSLLLESPRALSHLELQASLPHMDRVTLYRALDCLTEVKLSHKITNDDRISRYSSTLEEGANNTHHLGHQHAHFQCTRCSKVFCLEDNEPRLQSQVAHTLDLIAQRGFQNHGIELTIKGWCPQCGAEA
jgi:Fur family ferric uptake transcriptional regulator